jgi:hypothetical protein
MPEVPASAIPAAAWGISGRALTEREIAAADPFEGRGVRLDVPAGREITIADVQRVTGLAGIVLFASGTAWADTRASVASPAIAEDLRARWAAWLGPGRGDAST